MKERTKAQTVHHLLSLVKNSKLLGRDKKRREFREQRQTRITHLLLLAMAWVNNACCNSCFFLLSAWTCLKSIKLCKCLSNSPSGTPSATLDLSDIPLFRNRFFYKNPMNYAQRFKPSRANVLQLQSSQIQFITCSLA